MPSPKNFTLSVALSMAASLLFSGGFDPAPAAAADLAFFRAFTDKELGSKDRTKYERIGLPPGDISREVFAERTPTVAFAGKEILWIVGERTQTSEVLDRMVDEALQKRGVKQPPSLETPGAYSLTIIFNEAAAMRFRDFTRQHDREWFEIRLGGERFNVGRFIGPFTGNSFSTMGRKKQELLDLHQKFPGLVILHIE